MMTKRRMFDLNRLVTRIEAARVYGCTVATIDTHIRKGFLTPVFADGHIRLLDRDEVLRLKGIGLRPGRKKVAKIGGGTKKNRG